MCVVTRDGRISDNSGSGYPDEWMNVVAVAVPAAAAVVVVVVV